MFSFFKRSPIIDIDCFTCDGPVFEYAPIVNASIAKPEWFEKVQKSSLKYEKIPGQRGLIKNNNITLRSCYGFLELFKRGIILESWCDLAIESSKESYDYHTSYDMKPPVYHDPVQYSPGFKNNFIVKLESPWLIKSKDPTPFMLIGAEWHLEDYDFKVLPGVLNFKSQSALNVFISFRRKDDKFIIKMGQALLHIVPLEEKIIRLHNHLVTRPEFDALELRSTFTSGWRSAFNLSKRNSKRNSKRQSKCPFT